MRLHLIESDHPVSQPAESAFASLLLHVGLIWLAVALIAGAGGLPRDERSSSPLLFLPPDRHEAPPAGQSESFQLGRAGGLFADGAALDGAGSGTRTGGRPYGRQRAGERSSALGLAPFGRRPGWPTASSPCSRWSGWWSATRGAPRRSTRPG